MVGSGCVMSDAKTPPRLSCILHRLLAHTSEFHRTVLDQISAGNHRANRRLSVFS
jgi:hypothetical protein